MLTDSDLERLVRAVAPTVEIDDLAASAGIARARERYQQRDVAHRAASRGTAALPRVMSRPLHVGGRSGPPMIALSVILIAALTAIGVAIFHGRDRAAPAASSGSSVAITPAYAGKPAPTTRCAVPASRVVAMHFASSGNNALQPESLYFADGAPGSSAVLCRGTTAEGPPAAVAIGGVPGPLSYLHVESEAGGAFMLWGAVSPKVARVSVSTADGVPIESFGTGNDGGSFDSLGNGWHAFNTATYNGTHRLLVRAFDDGGAEIGAVTVS